MQVVGTNNIPNNNYSCVQCCSPQPTAQQPNTTAPQVQYQPQYAQPQAQGQNVQVPATNGVNIQIFNPSVTPPGALPPTYNVNAPNYYPPNYYTGQIGCPCCNGNNNSGLNSEKSSEKSTETTTSTDKKTEKKNIVMLTDQYIMNLENYLNSQDKDVRLGAAKEVYARLEEDPSRKDDKALTALINKMLQDPDEEIRLIALAALDGRYVLGDDYTVGLLQKMQQTSGGYGQDGVDASNILLKMSGPMIEKEVEVDPARQKKVTTKKETKKAK